MITIAQYVGVHKSHPAWTPVMQTNALVLLSKVNPLLEYLATLGVISPKNPATGSNVSGVTYGGWRPPECPQGAPNSSHKLARGVDVFDPSNDVDDTLTDAILERFALYREHPSATNTWCHLTDRAPNSKRRSFYP
jgi:hypothetical protein